MHHPVHHSHLVETPTLCVQTERDDCVQPAMVESVIESVIKLPHTGHGASRGLVLQHLFP